MCCLSKIRELSIHTRGPYKPASASPEEKLEMIFCLLLSTSEIFNAKMLNKCKMLLKYTLVRTVSLPVAIIRIKPQSVKASGFQSSWSWSEGV